MIRIRSLRATTLSLAAAALLAACGDDPAAPAAPSMEVVAGQYDAGTSFGALRFTTTIDGETTDWLAAGATLTLTLDADGTVAGRLFIPGMDEDGGDMDEDMAGAWTLSGSTVLFEQEADTFVRDMPFTYTDGVLSGDRTFDDVRVQVVLLQRTAESKFLRLSVSDSTLI